MLVSKKIIDKIKILDDLPKSIGFRQNVGCNSRISRKILDDEVVALKKVQPEMDDKNKMVQIFFREVVDQVFTDHPTVLPLRAFNLFHYSNKLESFIYRSCLATKFCDGGMLSSFLKKMKKNQYLPKKYIITQQYIFAYGIARGMRKLFLNGIIHRDLKSENIFVSKPSFESENIPDEISPLFNGENEYYIPYIADLGLSKVAHDTEQSQQCGTFYYLAPEVMSSIKYSFPADVYSYAVILSNIFQFKERPEFECTTRNTNTFIRHVTDGGRPKVNGCTSSQKKYLGYLWDNDPSKRLTFVDIVEYLENPNDDFIFKNYDKDVIEAYKKYIEYQINPTDSHSKLIIQDEKIKDIYKKYDKYGKNQEEYYRLDEDDAKILTSFSDETKSFENSITSSIIQNQEDCVKPEEYISSFINNLPNIQSENHFLKEGILSEAKGDNENAKEFYLNAIKSGSIQAATKLSILLLRNGDDEAKKKGFDLLQFAAEKKDKDGLFYFGYLLSEGFELKNVKADKEKAAMLLEESGKLGNNRGLFEAASIYHELAIESSIGNKSLSKKQLTKALQLYEESYEKYGDKESQNLSKQLHDFLEKQK